MARVEPHHIHRAKPDSLVSQLTSAYVSRPLVPLLIRAGLRNPNAVSLLSFFILIGAASLLVLFGLHDLAVRVAAAFMIALSFVLDCADGQIARCTNRTSIFGAWLDRYLDRISEMALYASIGYGTWRASGAFIYFVIGALSGFLFNFYSVLHSEKDNVFFEEIKKNGYRWSPEDIDESAGKVAQKKRGGVLGRKFFKGTALRSVSRYAFFYLNIGMGERYLYPVVFILLERTDLMLIIVLFLFALRFMNTSTLIVRNIVRNRI